PDTPATSGHTLAQTVDDRSLPSCDALLGPQDLRLLLLELRRHEPLRAGHRLPALVCRGHACEVRPRHFEVVPEDLVEADLQGRDAGPLAFARLQRGDVLFPVVARSPQLVELGVVLRTHRVTVAELRR